MKRHRARRTGFTLVELLVVIAIITVLIAIALPVYSRAREKARQSACMANLHQLAISVRMYALDFGHFPGPYDPATGRGGLNALYPTHLDNRAALICPDDEIVGNMDYIDQTVVIKYPGQEARTVTYATLLERADTMYLWEDPAFFVEHYSSYNSLYNWAGYVQEYRPDGYSLCNYQDQELSPGDNIAFWYAWHCWDPTDDLGVWGNPNIFNEVSGYLAYHLAQQVYWRGYFDEMNLPSEQQATRLLDNLGRPLWDPGNPDPWRYELYMPYGMPSANFPGLMDRNAPDNTILTRCSHHRAHTGVEKDIVVRLNGEALLVPGLSYDWAIQPRQTQ
jgi:prepilin-type N-terminal cleavage/methylation domain-containing protein